jgi:hypothetical protein
MEISSIDQEITDFDWYAVDSNGYLVQFASGGGTLPRSVALSSEALAQLHHYFLTLSTTETTTAHFNPDLSLVVSRLSNIYAYNLYIHSSANFAKSGLFAFNKTDLAHRDNYYHLVAYPAKPLLLTELPTAIRALISRTRLPFSIEGITTLNANDIQ